MAKKKSKAQKRQARDTRAKAKAQIVGRKGAAGAGGGGPVNKHALAPSGLRNNGNTCYYNSTLQCLAQVHALAGLLEERARPGAQFQITAFPRVKGQAGGKFEVEDSKLALSSARPSISVQFLALVKNITSKSTTVPALLHDVIRQKYSQFRGYSQQDAHELCLSLISNLRDEDIAEQRKAFVNKLKINMKNPSEEEKAKIVKYKASVNYTPIDSVFGGQLVSWVKCCDCQHVSFHMERFYDLSLSIPGDHRPFYAQNGPKNRRRKGDIVEKNLPPTPSPSEDEDDDEDDGGKEVENDVQKLSISGKKAKRQAKKAAKKAERLKRRPEVKKDSDSGSDNDSDKEEDDPKGNCDIVPEVPKESPKSAKESGKESSSESDKESSESDKESGDEEELLGTPEERQDFSKEVLQPIVFQAEQFDNKTLGDLLKNFISTDILEGDNRYLCESCSKKKGSKAYSTRAIKGQMIALPPQTLIVQLKRFEALGMLGSRARNMRKCNTKVEFPARLNISPFTSRIYRSLAEFYEPEVRLLEGQDGGLLDYDLFGVVVHMGDLGHGHYIAYVKVRKGKDSAKEYSRFLHLRAFFPNFEHVFDLWKRSRNKKNVLTNGFDKKKEAAVKDSSSDSSSDSEHEDEEKKKEKARKASESSAASKDSEGSTMKNGISDGEEGSEDSGSEDDDDDDDNDKKTDKKAEDYCWFYCSDSEVRRCDEDDVLNCCTGQYFMFYERAN